MDATKRPIKISPELVNYAEKHKIYEIMKEIVELLIIDRPDKPIEYLIEHLNKGIRTVPRIFILGPPESGKLTISKMLAGRFNCLLLTLNEVFKQSDNDIKKVADECVQNNKPIPVDVWTKALKTRLKLFDCESKGFVLVGFPETQEQVYALQCEGIFPSHVVILDAPDSMLIERADGKRVDPENGDIYHLVFDPPSIDSDVHDRLVKPAGTTPEEMHQRLLTYRRNMALVQPLYTEAALVKVINADQPVADVFQHSLDFSVTLSRHQAALRTPRIVLLGPPGSGKSSLANLIATKYGIQSVKCSHLIKEAINDGNKQGLAMQSFVSKQIPVPDSMLIKLIESKLTNVCCSTLGWLLYGYPRNAKQAEELECGNLEPNRVFFLDLPAYVSLERLCERRLDPVTGERYHLTYNPPPIDDNVANSQNIQKRLVTHPSDDVKQVKQRLGEYQATLDELKEFYKEKLITIDASQDLQNVFETLESYLVNPMPMRLGCGCIHFDAK